MRTKYFILSNNEEVWKRFPCYEVKGDFGEVLRIARNMVHQGHRLLSHPLTGSIKPRETEYKSILMTLDRGEMDFSSLKYIEGALSALEKFKKPIRNWSPEEAARILDDFRVIDCALITSGIEALGTGSYELVSYND